MQRWFYENCMVFNPEECHYMLISSHKESNEISLNGTEITNSNNEKLLDVLNDKK